MSSNKIYVEKSIDQKLQYLISDHVLSKFCDLENSRYILYYRVLWANQSTPEILANLSKTYESLQKKVLVFIVDDFENKYKYHKNLILFRTSLRATKKRPNEYVLPYTWECSHEPFPTNNHSELPLVGFCGLKSRHRKNLIQVFQQSDLIKTDFILKDNFWGGAPHDQAVIDEFNLNMKRSQFILANRGAGNFSMRFYQALAFGRIPVLVNTDMVLPFQDEINWQDFIVFEQNEKKCLQKVIDIHNKNEIQSRQTLCRELFDKYFSKDIMLIKMMNLLLNKPIF